MEFIKYNTKVAMETMLLLVSLFGNHTGGNDLQ